MAMKTDQFTRLLEFLERLDRAKIPYSMRHSRSEAIKVVTFAPGEYWEIEFLDDGEIEIERYRSKGHIDDESILEQLFAAWTNDDTSDNSPVNRENTIAGK